jgi:hypothetical protein
MNSRKHLIADWIIKCAKKRALKKRALKKRALKKRALKKARNDRRPQPISPEGIAAAEEIARRTEQFLAMERKQHSRLANTYRAMPSD